MKEPRINPYRMVYMDTAVKYLVEDFLPRYMGWFWDTHPMKLNYTPMDVANMADEWDKENDNAQ